MAPSEHEHEHENDAQSGHEHGHEVPRILVFFDYACPFCYVDQFRFDRLRAEFDDVEMLLMPFELRPDMPAEGLQMSELEAIGSSDRVEEHLLRIAEQDGFPMQSPPFVPHTHKALVIGEMGRERGESAHWAIHHALFGAYFGEGLDIGDEEVLLEIAQSEGYSPEDVRQAWESGLFDEQLDQFRHVGLHLGIDATPAALICNELYIGSRPYKVFKDALQRCIAAAEEPESAPGTSE
jgi:predicted DsbA family dithiol-disulfide isomerase